MSDKNFTTEAQNKRVKCCPKPQHAKENKKEHVKTKQSQKMPIKSYSRCTPMSKAALLIIAETCKQPKCPLTDEWIKKMWYIYTMEYYSAIKKAMNECHLQNMDTTRRDHTK